MKTSTLVSVMFAAGFTLIGGCAGPDWNEKPAEQTSAVRVLLVRHGESFGNLPRSNESSSDDPDHLTPRGWDQAAAAADVLRFEPTPLVVCSPARRARETAGAIAARWDGAVTLKADEAFSAFASTAVMQGMNSPSVVIGGGGDRAVEEINALTRQHPGRTMIVVTHGDVISALVSRAGGSRTAIQPGGITEIDIRNGQWVARQ